MTIAIVASRLPPPDLALTDADKSMVAAAVVSLLIESTTQHVHHLNATEHAMHVVLGQIYELLSDAADKLFETVKGRDATFALSATVSPAYVFLETPTVSFPAKSLDDLLSFLERSGSALSDGQLRNSFEEIRADLYRQRYLLGMTAAGVRDPSQPPTV